MKKALALEETTKIKRDQVQVEMTMMMKIRKTALVMMMRTPVTMTTKVMGHLIRKRRSLRRRRKRRKRSISPQSTRAS